MIFPRMLPLSILALVPISSAAPTPESVASSTDAIDWIPVAFEGKTLYVNSAALVESSIDPAKRAARSLLRRAPDSDACGGSSFNSHPALLFCHCRLHGLWYYGSCVFEAGTRNIFDTYIGSTDVRDVIRDALNKWQSGGVVASQGSMGCDNANGGSSLVNWKIKHS
ncbi:hypothetical protein BKA61DRAFT_676542 [Leptodontidium sp. MPI-SDFR-AT-0119]|nr:hypothetical protein BKA61DRAFT_676542 [Leptodontidium sp. MPI-SDFR-AT-0119]